MRIAEILRNKGAAVQTVPPSTTVCELIGDFARHNIGAVVVVDAGTVVGIVTERDIVRKLHERGPSVLVAKADEIMTGAVATCLPTDTVDSLAATMTERRIRHLPVVVEDRLVGIVSIGDVVKSRIDELQSERDQLESYIARG
ncbi:MAG: CBS domain-containing protein [Rhodococcus sp.]|uniref:CBS domain-containing protein n=1 Tax=Rhodococcus TaxID=1827 RepID=UPI00169CF904|nr:MULTISPECIES: CBS domain-containing protein [Rhodococcus]NLV78009.1 CBS domain-containing protein [Rhodococcus sp. (in: high G+C Gram-positive bacteria)]